jgi:hypothetical protein
MSEQLFVVPPSLKILPESAEVVVGESIQLSAKVTPSAANVSWSVDDVGKGVITKDGIYTAPPAVPTKGLVTVRASLESNVSTQAAIRILRPPPGPGEALILASLGGSAWSADRRASVSVPAGALGADKKISVSILSGAELPAAEPGRRVLGAVEFGPSGTVFSQAVTITIPLVRAYSAGIQLPLRFYDRAQKKYLDEKIFATVTLNGNQATAPISHFSIAVVDDASPTSPPTQPPSISSIRSADGDPVLLEGTKVPVVIVGDHLTDDLTPEIRTANGDPTGDITPETLFVKGTSAALALDVHTIRNFDSGTRNYQLRLVRPNGTFATTTISVRGLPELDVPPGAIVPMRGTNLFSEANVHGTVQVLSPETPVERSA